MKIYDVVVIGGGASGLIAAGRAAELGASVLILEKNQKLGIKLLMTGGGRCNFTNLASIQAFAQSLGTNGRWLLSGLSRFGPEEIIKFFEERGVKIQEEAGGRIFPKNGNAREILKVLVDYVKSAAVDIKTRSSVIKIVKTKNQITKIILEDKTEIAAFNFILACGGKSYPHSGSSGDAYAWLKDLGHKIISPKAALSPIIVKEEIKKLEGLSFRDASLYLYQGNEKINREDGDFIFTGKGLSGPAALNLSRSVARQAMSGDLKIKVDFFPNETRESLSQKIEFLISRNKQTSIKNILSNFCHKRLADFSLERTKINFNKKGGEVARLEKLKIIDFLKNYSLSVSGLGGFDEAMITVGGVYLKEVDPKNMHSKIITNLYLAGEILDLDGPTGGYNLQIAWTTGYLAGESAAQNGLNLAQAKPV